MGEQQKSSTGPARPLILTLLGWMLIALGAIEFVDRAAKIRWPQLAGDLGVALFELLILACGLFLLRAKAWARWLAVAWIGFHVAVGARHSVLMGVLHGTIFLLFVWLLFRPEVNAWFRTKPAERGRAAPQGPSIP